MRESNGDPLVRVDQKLLAAAARAYCTARNSSKSLDADLLYDVVAEIQKLPTWGVGDCEKAKSFDTTNVGKQKIELIFGEHPHSRCDNNIYARFGNGKIEAFDGFRTLVKVEIEEYNYMKESEFSGDEIRKGGTAKIYFDGVCCYEFFHRDALRALDSARKIIDQIRDKCSDWCKKESRDKLIGRKIYYREIPAVIDSLIIEQGCVMIKPESGKFPAPCYDKDREIEDTVKVEVTSPHIWWYRE